MSISTSDGILTIENGVLTHVNTKAEKVVIPKCVRKISFNAFSNCDKLVHIEFETGRDALAWCDVPGWFNVNRLSDFERSFLYNGFFSKSFEKIIDCVNKEIAKYKAKKEKIEQINIVTAKTILQRLIEQYQLDKVEPVIENDFGKWGGFGRNNQQDNTKKSIVLEIPIDNPVKNAGEMKISLSAEQWLSQRDKLPEFFSAVAQISKRSA